MTRYKHFQHTHILTTPTRARQLAVSMHDRLGPVMTEVTSVPPTRTSPSAVDHHATPAPDVSTSRVNEQIEAQQSKSSTPATVSAEPNAKPGNAMRVFKVPELLEKIIHFAVAPQKPKDYEILNFPPMAGAGKISLGGTCLFRLLCVNHAFTAAIQGSTSLKQLMYLSPRENIDLHREALTSENGPLPHHAPLFSILLNLNRCKDTRVMRRDFTIMINPHTVSKTIVISLRSSLVTKDFNLYHRMTSKFSKGWWDLSASWRQIKLCNAKQPLPITLSIVGDADWKKCWPDIGSLRIVRQFSATDTQGQAFDFFCQLFRSLDEIRELAQTKNDKSLSREAALTRECSDLARELHVELQRKVAEYPNAAGGLEIENQRKLASLTSEHTRNIKELRKRRREQAQVLQRELEWRCKAPQA